jgi:hypothetical protein
VFLSAVLVRDLSAVRVNFLLHHGRSEDLALQAYQHKPLFMVSSIIPVEVVGGTERQQMAAVFLDKFL